MTHVNESDIQSTIEETLIWDGWLVIRVNMGAMKSEDGERYVRFGHWQALGFERQSDGVSDLIASRDGRTYYIECKTPKGTQEASQKLFQLACEATGMQYILARDLADVAHLLTRVEYDGKRPGMQAVEVQSGHGD